jgi:PhnB protein
MKKKAAKKRVKPIPEGYHAITPYLAIQGAAKAIDFYQKAFGARVKLRMDGPKGTVGHAELKIGDSIIMLADESPALEFLGPKARGGTTVCMHLYVRDVDAVFAAAVAAGAKAARPVKDQFYGDRSGTVLDPFGHMWNLSTHTEDLTKAQLARRAEEAMKSG